MTHPTAVILVVGLSRSLLGEHTPRLQAFAGRGRLRSLVPVLPAVTCSVQSSMLTGLMPGGQAVPDQSTDRASGHGIVGNGWYDRESAEVRFWKQSNHLVHGEKVWETAQRRDPSVTCVNLFWWYNMYSSVDYSVTPRPIYKADGRKIPDIYTHPASLRDELQEQLGPFPLFHFWGPASSIRSSRWIADASLLIHQRFNPTLSLIYLPHLDYALQKLGPDHRDIPAHARDIDTVVGRLIDYFDDRRVRVMILSEYGIQPVDSAVAINRALRREGALRVRVEQGLELLDPGASDAFAVTDHQVAHVYVKDPAAVERYRGFCGSQPGVQRVLDRAEQTRTGLCHPRSGDLVLVAEPRQWFSYDYWLDAACAPDFARTVDIHRKPGYDPRELFLDPAIRHPRIRIARKLIQKKIGLRTLMNVIPLDSSLVRGSHGRVDAPPQALPVLITQHDQVERPETIPCQQVRDIILEHLF